MTYQRVGGELFDEHGNRVALRHLDLDQLRRVQMSPDPLERLRAVVEMHVDYPDDDVVVTTAVSLGGWQGGLTHGDLRALLVELGEARLEENPATEAEAASHG